MSLKKLNQFVVAGKLGRVFIMTGLLISSLFLGSCTWKGSSQPSVLVIFVESLAFNSFSCSDHSAGSLASSGTPVGESGFELLCEESVRFTHAYAPSTLSQPTIASILTARYPEDHGVRHNGAQFISAKIDTVAEVALRKGYRTSFFSGGAPIWRKAGFNQGFEIFDDTFVPSLKISYRPMGDVFRSFLNWRETEVAHSRFFSMLYLPDLQFIDAPTVNELGEARASSFKGQVEELDEALYNLFSEMKKRKIWDNTYVFLVGLNGNPADLRASESYPLNLFSENTRVSLLIKPQVRNRQSPMSWKLDTNVSLVDVGTTLYDFLGAELPKLERSHLNSLSLLPVLQNHDGIHPTEKSENPKSLPDENRWIFTESAWLGQQHLSGGTRFAIRKGELFFIYDEHRKFYNTLTDNLELARLPDDEPSYRNERDEFERYFRKQGLPSWVSIDNRLAKTLAVGREVWRPRAISMEGFSRLKILSEYNQSNEQLRGWRARLALRREDWKELKAAANLKNKEATWNYVAGANLNQKVDSATDVCFQHALALLRNHNEPVPGECDDPEVLALFEWLGSSATGSRRQKALEAFVKRAMPGWIEDRIAEQNYATGAVWDISIEKPAGPSLCDLILALPEARKFRMALRDRLKL